MAQKQQGGFGFGYPISPAPLIKGVALAGGIYKPQWSETAMTDHPSPIQINPDPRILTVLVIGTEDNVRAHILRQHTLGVAEATSWSKPIPVPHCPDKVMCALNRIMV